jgi:hypothetical protein
MRNDMKCKKSLKDGNPVIDASRLPSISPEIHRSTRLDLTRLSIDFLILFSFLNRFQMFALNSACPFNLPADRCRIRDENHHVSSSVPFISILFSSFHCLIASLPHLFLASSVCFPIYQFPNLSSSPALQFVLSSPDHHFSTSRLHDFTTSRLHVFSIVVSHFSFLDSQFSITGYR